MRAHSLGSLAVGILRFPLIVLAPVRRAQLRVGASPSTLSALPERHYVE